VVTLFFRQDVDFSSFFSLFSTPQKDRQNDLKMGLRAGHSVSIKMIMTNILVRSTSSSAYVHHNNFGVCVDIYEGQYTKILVYKKFVPRMPILGVTTRAVIRLPNVGNALELYADFIIS
jgi:hypothetical protein